MRREKTVRQYLPPQTILIDLINSINLIHSSLALTTKNLSSLALSLGAICSAAALSGCVTPRGIPQLRPEIEADRQKITSDERALTEGSQMFIKVYSYPYTQEQTLYGESWLLMSIGRQRVDLGELLEQLNQKPKEQGLQHGTLKGKLGPNTQATKE